MVEVLVGGAAVEQQVLEAALGAVRTRWHLHPQREQRAEDARQGVLADRRDAARLGQHHVRPAQALDGRDLVDHDDLARLVGLDEARRADGLVVAVHVVGRAIVDHGHAVVVGEVDHLDGVVIDEEPGRLGVCLYQQVHLLHEVLAVGRVGAGVD